MHTLSNRKGKLVTRVQTINYAIMPLKKPKLADVPLICKARHIEPSMCGILIVLVVEKVFERTLFESSSPVQ